MKRQVELRHEDDLVILVESGILFGFFYVCTVEAWLGGVHEF